MFMNSNQVEHKDPLVRIKMKAMAVIARYGSLRWCTNSVCGCMGCANSSMTKEEYELAKTMPEVVEMLGRMKPAQIGRGLRVYNQTNDFSKLNNVVEPVNFFEVDRG